MIEISDAAGQQDVVREKIVSALHAGAESYRDTLHLCRLALTFARRGHHAARSALYSTFRKDDDSTEPFAAEEIIALDGTDGLLFVSERIGEWLAADPEILIGDYALFWYDEHNGEGSAERVLTAAARQNERIAAYMAHIRSERDGTGNAAGHERPHSGQLSAMSPDEVIHFIEAGTPGFGRYALSGWGRRATEDDLRPVAERMFREQNPDRLSRFLGLFHRRPLPEYDARLLGFAQHPDHHVRRATMFVLAQHNHADVRSLALDRVRAGRHSEGELMLFSKKRQPKDWYVIRESLRWPDDAFELHSMLMDLLQVYADDSGEEAREALLLVYEHSPCTNCRSRAVEALCKGKLAPNWLLEECCFDVDEETRSIVRTQ